MAGSDIWLLVLCSWSPAALSSVCPGRCAPSVEAACPCAASAGGDQCDQWPPDLHHGAGGHTPGWGWSGAGPGAAAWGGHIGQS